MDKAKQYFLSKSIEFFRYIYDGRFGLTCVNDSGYDPSAPCLFHGMYGKEDITRFMNHRGKRIVVWGGGDAQKPDVVATIASVTDTRHISTSRDLDWALRQHGLKPDFYPLPSTIPENWIGDDKPIPPCGPKIFSYAPNEAYGRSLVEAVAKVVEFEVVLTGSERDRPVEELYRLYADSFIGLRLKGFDGVAATVQEMGLMGRRSVWNGGTPSAIQWHSLEDVVKAINAEAWRIGKTLPAIEVSNMVREWICTNDAWTYV
jgi:hypothetical protein